MMITVCILAKNSARTLEKTLDSVKDFKEVLLLDNGSTDETLQIGGRYPNVVIHEHSFIGFGPLRNLAASLASHDWILALDTDEVLSDVLLEEILKLALDPSSVYAIGRHNYYNGKWIKGCGWYPDRVIRLYHRKMTQYCNSQVHESVQVCQPLTAIKLKGPLLHTPFFSTAEFLQKMQHYSSLFADQHAFKKRSSFAKAFFHSFFAFFRSYFLQRGFLLGKEGFIISLYNSNTVFYKYLKVLDAVRFHR